MITLSCYHNNVIVGNRDVNDKTTVSVLILYFNIDLYIARVKLVVIQ
jgi:hypothetical protein